MLLLTSLVHSVFAGIFFLFHRYIELGVVVLVWIIFVSKIVPPLDVIRKPKFFKKKIPESDAFEQSLYLSSGILFYTALVGVALGIAEALGVPVDLQLLYYCVLFLTSVIYALYLLFYPKNPNVFVLFRTHTMIASLVLGLLTLTALLFGVNVVEPLQMIDLAILTGGLAIVIRLDRTITINIHIANIYFFIFAVLCLVAGTVSFLALSISMIFFCLLSALTLLYIFFPSAIRKTFKSEHIPLISWHFSNCVLACTWAIFGFVFWSLFWGPEYQLVPVLMSLFLLFGLWFWVYSTEEENPIFFSGMVIALSTLVAYGVFSVLPPIFWMVASTLFVYAGGLLLFSRIFKNKIQELILAGGAVVFLCASDIVLILQDHGLFALASVFLFQSLVWYGAYEIFHRQSHAKNPTL